MTAGARLGRAPAVLARHSLGSVLVRLPDGPLHTLTGTSAAVWELLETEPTAGEVATALGLRYDGAAADILADVATLLSTLIDAGLVVARPGEPADPAAASDPGRAVQ